MVARVGRNLGVALLLIVVAFTAAEAYRNEITSAGYIDVRDTPCWPCHVTWDPPITDNMVRLSTASSGSAEVGGTIDFTLLIQNGWISDLERFEPSLDIGSAPSLGFVSDKAPDVGRTLSGVAETAGGTGTAGSSGFVVVDIEPGVTDLAISLSPSNRDTVLGPDFVLNIFPGKTEPEGNPDVDPIDEAGAGGLERFKAVGASAISELGFGSWVIEAEAKTPLQGGNIAAFSNNDFTVTVDKFYNASTETVQFLSGDGLVPPGGSTAFTWTLRVVAPPGPGETVLAAANVTSYYEHDDGSTEDVGYTHHSTTLPVISVADGASFEAAPDGPIVVDAAASVGVSMSRISEIVGYVSAFLVLASIYTGGMFGKASRRQLNKVFETARRRVAFHNFLSYGIILAAFVHMIIFLIPGLEGNYHWTLGLIWGSLSILAMFGLGVTGAIQVPMIRRWNYSVWRWTHFGLSIATIVFTIVHILLDGGNFGNVQEALDWTNPLDTRDLQ